MAVKKTPEVKYLHLPLSPEFHTVLKVHCASVNEHMQDFAMKAVKEKVEREKKRVQ